MLCSDGVVARYQRAYPRHNWDVLQTVSVDTSPECLQTGYLTRFKYQIQNGAMKYGYARVSTEEQNPALQLAALKRQGAKRFSSTKGYRERRPSALPWSAV